MNLILQKYESRLKRQGIGALETLLHVNILQQRLNFLHLDKIERQFPISTSKYGIGPEENSFKTPTGIHRISQKIGNNAKPWSVFKDRKNTGVIAERTSIEENLILSRILRLEGLEEGINQGPGIDSFDRYIYIHGTNREDTIGIPSSHGCICMKNDDIITLFTIVSEGTIVIID